MGFSFILKASIIYLFLIYHLSLSKKLSSADSEKLKSKNLNECQRCKVLVESFDHWLDRTSRGKFEGGDAAWEESKLKSYARSEIRLVEIQEGLCSERKKHQDQCYKLAEESEQALEKWWFHEDATSSDLHTWLCIETLQYCCPENHYGESCELCPLDKDNKVCAGNGKCHGEGTRRGNGGCRCNKGYTGLVCSECANDFFRGAEEQCQACHKACNGCSGEGPDACESCKAGWQLESGVCTDVNECLEGVCNTNTYCINKEGAYSCNPCDKTCLTCKGPGLSNCTSCEPSSVLWSGVCVDSKLKDELLSETLKRLALYFGLLLMTLFICRTSKALASLIVIIIAFYVYLLEKSSKVRVLDVIYNLYF